MLLAGQKSCRVASKRAMQATKDEQHLPAAKRYRDVWKRDILNTIKPDSFAELWLDFAL